MSTSQQTDIQTDIAPRFALGQRVRVIANQGGLYSAQIGVVGVIAKQRQKLRYGYRSYDMAYTNERGGERILIVREDDLEAVGDASVEETPTLTPEKRAGFSAGQQVRVISVNDVHLVGVVGSIVRERPPRRWNQRTYDFAYSDDEGREVLVYGIREDDLEAVADESPATAIPEQLAEKPAELAGKPDQFTDAPMEVAALFRLGQRVTVHPPADGLEDEYPSFTRYPVVGEIASACQVTHAGVHCYDVRFPRIVGNVSTDSWPPVSIREAHLVSEPSPVGWMAHAAAMARTKAPQNPQPQSQPKFSVGEHITVDAHSALCYETFTRKGAVGEIIEVGKPIRGIRRYTVRFEVAHLGGARESRIREEHLVKTEAPAPRQYTQARHAYEYRDEHPRDPHLWCDAGGCFIEACPVCQQHPVPTLFTTQSFVAPATVEPPALPYSTAALAALAAGDAYEFAVALVRDKLERGVWRDAILAWQTTPQWIHSVDGGTCYDVTRGGFYLTMLNGQKCSIRYALKTLLADAERRIAGLPRQTSLWKSEVAK